MNNNPSAFPDRRAGASPAGMDADNLPVETVTWSDAVEFCHVLTEQEKKAGRLPIGWEYRLPTEAQWEYACRAGTQTAYSFGDDEERLADFGWYAANSEDRTHEVGQKKPNHWGLHDMHGNVWEWCSDWYQKTLVGGTDPEVTERASDRADRGGSWLYEGWLCRSAIRSMATPVFRHGHLGFRVALISRARTSHQGNPHD